MRDLLPRCSFRSPQASVPSRHVTCVSRDSWLCIYHSALRHVWPEQRLALVRVWAGGADSCVARLGAADGCVVQAVPRPACNEKVSRWCHQAASCQTGSSGPAGCRKDFAMRVIVLHVLRVQNMLTSRRRSRSSLYTDYATKLAQKAKQSIVCVFQIFCYKFTFCSQSGSNDLDVWCIQYRYK